jgi:hypothetical protein
MEPRGQELGCKKKVTAGDVQALGYGGKGECQGRAYCYVRTNKDIAELFELVSEFFPHHLHESHSGSDRVGVSHAVQKSRDVSSQRMKRNTEAFHPRFPLGRPGKEHIMPCRPKRNGKRNQGLDVSPGAVGDENDAHGASGERDHAAERRRCVHRL